ncbi:hypothetical protein [Sinorhizobium medicae]|uniref:hypothetical protein n=1 Tax=Sinorhizobium medicae TaxID=110321 RepID=UPI0018659067|nr:hypothetical protein [Sinorhizobium medicae]
MFYLDMSPPIFTRKDGSTTTGRALFEAPTSRAFVKQDLYSTFFGTTVNDEIERRLFGDIDGRGADAIRAFTGLDQSAWHSNFETFFEYIDVQKLRTPKGLDWLKKQYPELSQNELMLEMQGIRFLNCTIWTTGVREIVSAEKATVKFIVTDHPVTIYNHAIPPSDRRCIHPDDPAIALKGSQTIHTGPRTLSDPEQPRIRGEAGCESARKPDLRASYRCQLVDRSTLQFPRPDQTMFEDVNRITHIGSATGTYHDALERPKLSRRVELDETALLDAVVHAHCVRLKFDIVHFNARPPTGEILVAVVAAANARGEVGIDLLGKNVVEGV